MAGSSSDNSDKTAKSKKATSRKSTTKKTAKTAAKKADVKVEEVAEESQNDAIEIKEEVAAKVEVVDAEIVEATTEDNVQKATEKEEIESLASETISEDEKVTASATISPSPEEGGGFMSPGVILVGILALGAVVLFLWRGGNEGQAVTETATSTVVAENVAPVQQSLSDELGAAPVTSDDVKEVVAVVASGAAASEEAQEAIGQEVEPVSALVETEVLDPPASQEVSLTPEGATELLAAAQHDNAADVSVVAEEAVTELEVAAAEVTKSAEDVVESVPTIAETAAMDEGTEQSEQLETATVVEEVEGTIASTEDVLDSATETLAEIATSTAQETQIADQTIVAESSNDSATPEGAEMTATEALQDEAVTAITDDGEATAAQASSVMVAKAAQVEQDTAEEIARLETSLASLKDDVKDEVLAETRAALEADKARMEAQQLELAALRTEFDEAIASQDKKSLARLAELEARIERIRKSDVAGATKQAAGATKQAAVAIALTNLREQISTGRGFSEQLEILTKLTPETSGMRQLAPYAKDGLPSLNYLQRSYSESARKALAGAKRDEAKGPLGKFTANITNLFSVRKVGHVEGDSPSAIISRAEKFLEDGDLATSVGELEALEGSAAQAMSSWLELAQNRVTADQLIGDISNNLLQSMQ